MFGVGVRGERTRRSRDVQGTLEDGTAQTPSDFLNVFAHDQLFSAYLTSTSGPAATSSSRTRMGPKSFPTRPDA